MKKWVFVFLFLWVAYEILKIYFIMPFPGSQKEVMIDFSYSLHKYRWLIRMIFLLGIILSVRKGLPKGRAIFFTMIVLLGVLMYFTHNKFSADSMFLPPKNLNMANSKYNRVDSTRTVLGLVYRGIARAYPIQYIAYHHQVLDTIEGNLFMITYCSVCRTGRIFIPEINGKRSTFRLVGMDQFNAMFEDQESGSWWRQANGECVAGKHKGKRLKEYPSEQMVIKDWFKKYPDGLVMQPDNNFHKEYEKLSTYESGKSKGHLIRTDSLSWNEKSWVIGVVSPSGQARAYDWKEVSTAKYLIDTFGKDTMVVMAEDQTGKFGAWKVKRLNLEAIKKAATYEERLLIIHSSQHTPMQTYQEYWHSWRTFKGGDRKLLESPKLKPN